MAQRIELLGDDKTDDLRVLALALVGVIRKIFEEKEALVFLGRATVERKRIIEFRNRMRAFDIEKFPTPTFISVINFYATSRDMARHQALGFLMIYLPKEEVPRLIELLKYPEIGQTEREIKDACGALCNIIAGRFKSEISAISHLELEMSPFSFYNNSAVEGVEFCPTQPDKYEVSFEIEGQKRLVVEMSLGRIPLIY
jgi:hypothetical protein